MNGVPASVGSLVAEPAVRAGEKDSGLPELLLALGATSIVLGLMWDISWHISIGRDTFWTPAHICIYAGGVLGGCVGGWLALKNTFLTSASRAASVRVFGLRAPLGGWVAMWGALAMVTSAPFDDWWHNAYGLDVKIISPPHAVLGLGMFGISVGAVLLALARQNRTLHAADAATLHGPTGLFLYAGGIFVLIGAIFLSEFTLANHQHGAFFYHACAVMMPFRLVALGRAGRISWPATRIAAVYMGFVCLMIWILPLFPAQPKLAPIYNPVTHMVPPGFPLLLIFPAAAIDLVLSRTANNQSWWKQIALAVMLGAIFLAVFMAVQWFFSEFMLSPHANNWFFAGGRAFGYGSGKGQWRTQFWHLDRTRPDANPLTFSSVLLSWALAVAGSWIGLLWGGWMRKVQR